MLAVQNIKKNLTKFLQTHLGSLNLYVTCQPSLTFCTVSKCAADEKTGLLNFPIYGQPVSATHPHLINDGELVPGVTLREIQKRRTQLMLSIQQYAKDYLQTNGNTKKNHVVVVPSSTKKFMSDKIPYIYRQSSDFLYLTGCQEPDTILVLYVDENGLVNSTLFMRPKDTHTELWEGPRTGAELATEFFGVDQAHSTGEFEKEMKRRIQADKPLIWYDMKNSALSEVSETMIKILSADNENKVQLKTPTPLIHRMRLFKSEAEQALMRRTCQIASTAINEVMKESKPGISEHHIFAMTDYKCRMRNASHLAYPPVVASGKNATVIHYINNTQLCKSGDLVLLDAGCEYGGYSSDITRTWPINGTFTDAQRTLYDIVLQLQKELIDTLMKDGEKTLDGLFETMCFKLGKYLQEIGLVPKFVNNVVDLAKAGYKFCPHHVSHYLGMDIHDTPSVSRSINLVPGMVFTVEPGIYISQDRTDVPVEFRGMGIRVEDDILITKENKVEVLTAACIKEIGDLENLHKIQ